MSLSNIAPTTELEALNTVLGGIGESPVDSLESTQPDVLSCLRILRETSREVQSGNWRFNTQFRYRLTSSATYSWDGTDLNIFTPPANALRAEPHGLTLTGQLDRLNVVLRQAERYTVGDPAVKPLVFFDLDTGRDGFPTTGDGARSELLLDVVWAFDFIGLPEAVRRYVGIRSARRAAKEVLGDASRARFDLQDEAAAYREVVRSQRPTGAAKLLTPQEHYDAVGGRPLRVFTTSPTSFL